MPQFIISNQDLDFFYKRNLITTFMNNNIWTKNIFVFYITDTKIQFILLIIFPVAILLMLQKIFTNTMKISSVIIFKYKLLTRHLNRLFSLRNLDFKHHKILNLHLYQLYIHSEDVYATNYTHHVLSVA